MATKVKAGKTRRARTKAASPSSDERVLDVTVVLLENGYASTAIVPIEIFHSAGTIWNWLNGTEQKPRFRVLAASLDGRPVTSICSLGLIPYCSINDIEHTDIVILPASGWDVMARIASGPSLLPWLRKMHARGSHVAGVCTGVGFLAEAGLLDGREATTHWGVAAVMQERYPNVRWRPDQIVTEADRVFCSGGVYASVDLSLHLVEKFCGRETALQVAKSLLLTMPRERQSGYSALPLSPPHSDERIRRAEEYLRRHFSRGVPTETLAEQAGMGPRNFIRRFKAVTGRLPSAYVQALRISAAKEMLELGAASIQEVSSTIGYGDIAFFRELFKRHAGMTPTEYRSRFANMNFKRNEMPAPAL
jgi:transcriptional regulator GlxA family with amidase domain